LALLLFIVLSAGELSTASAESAESIGLTCTPCSLSFGTVALYETSSLSLELSNQGKSKITIARFASANPNFFVTGARLPVALEPGQAVKLKASFHPRLSQYLASELVLTTLHGYTLTVAVQGTGKLGSLLPSPSALSFGSVSVGATRSATVSLTNQANYRVKVWKIAISGSGFSLSGLDLPLELKRGESFTFTASFAPQAASATSGIISAVSNTTALRIPISGTGASPGVLGVSPSALSFGNVGVGTSASRSGSLTASGSSVTVTSASIGTSEFALGGIALPVTIPAGHSVAFSVAFKPQAAGAASTSLTFLSSASDSRAYETVAGTGTASAPASSYRVSLSWEASSSSVAGYYVYRGTTSGGPYSRIDSAIDTENSYTDTTVLSGQTYYYVTASVTAKGVQSKYSNQVTATIP
jgi:hypothetical protein